MMWDNPTMKVIADQKRRVVLPKPAMPGDVYECLETGDRIVLLRMQIPKRNIPPLAKQPPKRNALKGLNLDEPAFAPMNHEGVA